MGFIGDLFGGKSDSGMSYRAAPVSIQNPTSQAQINDAYLKAQGGLGNQNAFVQALQAAANPALANQTSLSNMLMLQAQGGGPNPAQAELQQNVGQIARQQAGAIASQKGLSPALAARLAAQQGGDVMQNAAGQAAVLRANQTLAAQQLAAQQSAQQIGQAMTGQQAYNQAAQSEQGNLLNSQAQYNNAAVGGQSSMNSANAAVQGRVVDQQGGLFGGLLGGVGSALGLSDGGMVNAPGDVKKPDDWFSGMGSNDQKNPIEKGMNSFASSILKHFDNGGIIDVDFHDVTPPKPTPIAIGPVSEFGKMLSSSQRPMLVSQGALIPGKAMKRGDSSSNDTIPAMLSPKEIVLPRSITMSDNAPQKAAEFVAALLSQKGKRK